MRAPNFCIPVTNWRFPGYHRIRVIAGAVPEGYYERKAFPDLNGANLHIVSSIFANVHVSIAGSGHLNLEFPSSQVHPQIILPVPTE